MKALRHIRHCLDNHTASLIAHALISSHLDYANSVLLGASQYVIDKLQCIQNALARIVLQSDSLAHSQPLFQQLHWLPVHSRIRFKLATITYRALSSNSPHYLASLLHQYQPVRSLCSCNLECNTSWNPLLSLYGYLQTEPKNPLLPLPTGLDRFLPVHQIHLFDILHVNIKLGYIYILHLIRRQVTGKREWKLIIVI
jgi:hypothetical protein